MSNIATGANAVMDIRVDWWSTERERDELIATFLEGGQDEPWRIGSRLSVEVNYVGATGSNSSEFGVLRAPEYEHRHRRGGRVTATSNTARQIQFGLNYTF